MVAFKACLLLSRLWVVLKTSPDGRKLVILSLPLQSAALGSWDL